MQSVKSRELQKRSHQVIPGGAHTYAKGDDQYPDCAPAFIVGGEGSHVWDVDGNEFIEYGMGLRSVTLGHAYKPVIDAAYRQMMQGSNFTRPSTMELACAETLLGLLPSGEMVKFAKNGSDVTTAALKLARAYTGRDRVAICAEQPFFSTDDWCIGSTPMAAGVPQAVRELTLKFRYNDLASLRSLFAKYPGEIACVIMEAETVEPPHLNFLQSVRDLCHANGAIFILDEIITGFRWHLGGAQCYYDLDPDLSTFGKALGNGFSISALVGKRELMRLGGLCHDKERVFLLSSTHGGETHSLAAALEVMRIYQREGVIERLYQSGEYLLNSITDAITEHHLNDYFCLVGHPTNLSYVTRDQNQERSQAFRTLFLQETIKRGLLMSSLAVSYAHSNEDLERTVYGVNEALYTYRKALNEGVDSYLVGRAVQPIFRKYN